MSDAVNHPSHYNWLPGVECMDVVKHFAFAPGNAIKYIWRAGRKGDSLIQEIQDNEKAVYYLGIHLEMLRARQETQATGLAKTSPNPTYNAEGVEVIHGRGMPCPKQGSRWATKQNTVVVVTGGERVYIEGWETGDATIPWDLLGNHVFPLHRLPPN